MVWSCPRVSLQLWKTKEEQPASVAARASLACVAGPSSAALPSLPSSLPSRLSPGSPACWPPVWAG